MLYKWSLPVTLIAMVLMLPPALCGQLNSTLLTLTTLERQLYGHTYPQQPLMLRLNRIETSVWGQPAPAIHPPSSRVEALKQKFDQYRNTAEGTLRTLAYVERRLGVTPAATASTSQRLATLEAIIFGEPPQQDVVQDTSRQSDLGFVNLKPAQRTATPSVSLEQRLQRLTQHMPLTIKTIQLVKPSR